MNIPITISGCVDGFLDAARIDQTLSGESLTKYRSSIQNFIKTMGDLEISEITEETFREMKRRVFERGVGASFTNGIIHAMKRLLEYCRAKGFSVMDVSAVKPLPVPRREVGYLTQDEIERFVDSIRVHTRMGEVNRSSLCFRAIVETIAGTGMRISEVLGLDVRSIDWKNQEASIIGKGGKQRKVFFSERAFRWLKRYLEQREDHNAPMFVSAKTGRRISRHEAQRQCRVVAARAGIGKKVTLHVLRHTFATTLLRNGCPVGHIQGLLGHQRLETTCRYYLGLIDDKELKNAHQRFVEW